MQAADATYSLQRDLETQSALIDRSVLFEPGDVFGTFQGTEYIFHFKVHRIHVLHFTGYSV